MMRTIQEVMTKDYLTIGLLDGVQKIINLSLKSGINYCLVEEHGLIVGIVTSKDLIKAHPNRIVADIMSKNILTMLPNSSLWESFDKFNKTGSEIILVTEGNIEKSYLHGIITRTDIKISLGRHIDLLTGLHRGDYIYYNATNFLNQGIEISIIFIDINNFGEIDKVYGHTLGDNILVEVSSLLRDNVPKGAFLSRFGGDEFIILSPTHLEESITLANILSDAISSHAFSQDIAVSVSIGIVGGRRYTSRDDNPWQTIKNLLNIASLHSTAAKKDSSHLSVGTVYDIDEIA